MNGQIFKLEVPEHQAVQELLTWHASGKLAPDEAERVARHVQSCAQCRQDLQWERELLDEARRDAHAGDEAEISAALARLLPRLGEQEGIVAGANAVGMADVAAVENVSAATEVTQVGGVAPMDAAAALPAGGSPWWRTLAANEPRWLRWAALAQCVIIAGLALLLARPEPEAAYHALGADVGASALTPSSGNIVVIFAPGTAEQDLRRLLQAQDARIVDGPTVTGAYVLDIPAAGRVQALQTLRASPAVKLAEPLDSGATP